MEFFCSSAVYHYLEGPDLLEKCLFSCSNARLARVESFVHKKEVKTYNLPIFSSSLNQSKRKN